MSVVPDTTTKINFDNSNTTFNTSGVQYIINPYCELALSKAIELNEKHGGETTVIHVGGAQNEPVIRKALAMGAHRAVRIDTNPKDGQLVAKEIASYAKDKNFDLILSGRESIDYNSGMVGILVAAHLGIEHANVVTEISIDNGELHTTRDIDGGKEKISIPLPASASAQKDLIDPKIPNMRGIMQARTKPLEVVSKTVEDASVVVSEYSLPDEKQEVQMFETEEISDLFNILKNDKKLF